MPKEKKIKDSAVTYSVTQYEDGVYRWRYDVNLFTNLSICFLVWKILFACFAAIFLLVMVADGIHWGFTAERVASNLKILLYVLIGMTVISAMGYFLYAAIMGGKYCIIFEMDEHGINHRQIDAQAKKAKKLAAVTALTGAAAGRMSTVGVGMSAARTEMYSDFSKVKKIKSYPKKHLIKVNGKLSRNQIFAASEDFAFVEEYIRAHCPQQA